MGKKIDLAGQRFERLMVIEEIKPQVSPCGQRSTQWLCKCDCGKNSKVSTNSLRGGKTKSCGCYSRARATTHGLKKHPLYRVWLGMKSRCCNNKMVHYEYYGGRGINICNEWECDFKAFHDWCMGNGWQKGLQIDRIDNDGNYEPSNCRLVTPRENCLNSRLLRSDNSSGYRGVCWNESRRKWYVKIAIKGKQIYVGYYDTIKEAVNARNHYIVKNKLEHEYEIQSM